MPISSLNEMHNDFLVSAKEINNNRAFPDARDGLKPSMRAVLWEMFIRGYSSNKAHVKSAKVDGGVIANWHPHGSEYSTMVRMSQPWVNNIPEINWHGANGSLLGGPQAAASRYTECRLATASEDGFFTNIKKETVDMIPNFSEDDEWPSVFPAIFPRLFINGSQGIGYTIAQEWEPGNLNEFYEKVKQYLKKKKITYDDIYPDYPTAGIIINKNDIHTIYETGKGSIILRGKTKIENNIIKITSLPYQVYVEPFISSIKDLVNSNKLSGIEDIYNKSDDSGMLVEIECSDNPEYVLNQLFKLTDLQCTFSANQMALVNGVPELLTLEKYIKLYIDHNIECIKREYTYDLTKANLRKEIVNGLLNAILNIDKIIELIKKSKSSDDAKANLIKKFKFTDNQAKAIVDMKLGKLAHLEGVELNSEKTELDKTITNLNNVLASDKLLEKEFLKRLEAFVKKYSWPRRTEVINLDTKEETQKIKAVKTSSEQFMIALMKDGTIKRLSLAEYREKDDKLKAIKVNSKAKFILISNLGKMYKLLCNKINLCTMKSSGSNINILLPLEENEKIINIFTGEETEQNLVMITDAGRLKKMLCSDIFIISKNIGTVIMKLKDEEIIFVDTVDEEKITVITNKKSYSINTTKYNTKGRGAGGNNCIKLKPNEFITKLTC